MAASTPSLILSRSSLPVMAWPASKLGSEFMPTLNEGTLFYMPTTLPGLSITKAAELLQTQNKIIRSFPEVDSVWGKAGRAATATDPAPTEMFETVINLKPESQWRSGMTTDKLIDEMDKALQFPGVSNAWTMPIKARIDMLATGIRTPVGVKVIGQDLKVIERLAREIEAAIKTVPGTSSAFAERIIGGYYLDIEPDRRDLADRAAGSRGPRLDGRWCRPGRARRGEPVSVGGHRNSRGAAERCLDARYRPDLRTRRRRLGGRGGLGVQRLGRPELGTVGS